MKLEKFIYNLKILYNLKIQRIMKKIFLFMSLLLILGSLQAQVLPIPNPSTPNVLFLKYSIVLNGEHSFIPESNISIYPEPVDFKPVYLFWSDDNAKNASMSILMNFFYVPNENEFAYIDPSAYNDIAISRTQLVEILRTKTTQEGKNYLNGFTAIYLIDYEQKNRLNPNQVKILKVKPYYDFFKY
ncbi:MAG: hypothetical protein OHK0045_17180 [Raineya sp.]